MTPDEALGKLQKFCAYQERSTKEVTDKLKRLNVEPINFSKILSKLKEDNFLNEKRFAKAFVQGKLRYNKWGKIKLKYELIKRQIPPNIIAETLSNIDSEEYNNIFKNVIDKKLKEYELPLNMIDRNKVIKYIISKGFEAEMINID